MENRTKICKYCRTEIDSKASVCPNCRKSQSSLGCLLALLAVPLFILITLITTPAPQNYKDSGSMVIENNQVADKAKPITEETATNQDSVLEEQNIWEDDEIAETEVVAESDFSYEISDTSFEYYTNSIGSVEFYGIVEVTNTGTSNIYLHDCVFDLEDNDGHLLQSENMISACPDIIAPGEKGYFYNNIGSTYIDKSVSLDNGLRLVPSYKIEKATGVVVDYDVTDTAVREADYGLGVKATGRITNNTEEDCGLLYVEIIYYNSDGKVIAISGTNVTDLSAGTTKSFEDFAMFANDSLTINNVANYKVIARKSYYQW